jgi:hypothetical protein
MQQACSTFKPPSLQRLVSSQVVSPVQSPGLYIHYINESIIGYIMSPLGAFYMSFFYPHMPNLANVNFAQCKCEPCWAGTHHAVMVRSGRSRAAINEGS